MNYHETVRKYELGNDQTGRARLMLQRWERIYLEEGAEGLIKERRGRACSTGGTRKGRPPKLDKKVADATPVLHSDQGWQYQHAEHQRLLAEHNITQSMSRKGNCMDNGTMENFFGRLKVEMFYDEKFESVNAFIDKLKNYIDYYNNERISLKLRGMSPVQYRTHSLAIKYFILSKLWGSLHLDEPVFLIFLAEVGEEFKSQRPD